MATRWALRADDSESQLMGRTRTLDSHASRLRRKLDPDGARYVFNCWGVLQRRLVQPIVVPRVSLARAWGPNRRWAETSSHDGMNLSILLRLRCDGGR